jgi:hypothetical protein
MAELYNTYRLAKKASALLRADKPHLYLHRLRKVCALLKLLSSPRCNYSSSVSFSSSVVTAVIYENYRALLRCPDCTLRKSYQFKVHDNEFVKPPRAFLRQTGYAVAGNSSGVCSVFLITDVWVSKVTSETGPFK